MKILIIGKNGFLAKSLYELFKNENFEIYNSSREELDFLFQKSVDNYFSKNSFDILIFTPVFGGKRNETDSSDIVYNNLLMFENFKKHVNKFKLIFYFGSGASFDRKKNIYNYSSNTLGQSIPIDYYGLSKYIMEENVRNIPNIINLRLFGCFGFYEPEHRLIKSNIINYINNKNITIFRDKYFDQFYIEDLYLIIKYYIFNIDKVINKSINKEVNCVYKDKLKLSDIINIINNLDSKKVNIHIKDKNLDNSYCGNSELEFMNLQFIGLKTAIQKLYNNLKSL